MKNSLKALGLALLAIGVASSLGATPVPEIDASTGMNAIALLGGAVLVLRARKR